MEEDPTIPEISEETVENVARAKYVLSKIQEYTDLIEMLRPLKRPMLLWSVASLVYVYGGLHFASGRAALWGVEIAGVTEREFSFFLFLATTYYTLRWAWRNWLHIRTYWREGYLSALWWSMPRKAAVTTGISFEFSKGYHEAMKPSKPLTEEEEVIQSVLRKRSLLGVVDDLIGQNIWQHFIRVTENFGVPFLFPVCVAVLALGSLLWCRIL